MPVPEDGGRAVALVGVEVHDQHPPDLALVVEDLRRQGHVGVDAEPAAPARGRMVVAAAEVDGDPVLQGQAAGQDRPARWRTASAAGSASRSPRRAGGGRPAPPGCRPARRGSAATAGTPAVWTFRRSCRVDRAGPHEVPGPAQATGDEGVVDAAVLAAVEGVEPLQPEGRDVVAGVVDERDHARDSGTSRANAAPRRETRRKAGKSDRRRRSLGSRTAFAAMASRPDGPTITSCRGAPYHSPHAGIRGRESSPLRLASSVSIRITDVQLRPARPDPSTGGISRVAARPRWSEA